MRSIDNVFYKLPDQCWWQGPAAVIARDGKVVLIQHGSIHHRLHPCRLQDVKADYISNDVKPKQVGGGRFFPLLVFLNNF